MMRWFVTGTDTGIGKTHAACKMIGQLAGLGHRVAGMKPIASGCEATPGGLRNEDALAMMEAANVELAYDSVNPYAFGPAIAPHLAAHIAGVEIDPGLIAHRADEIEAECLVIEGAGGWCVPIGNDLMLADLARPLARDVVVVVGMRLGCINHALLTAEQVQRDGFRLAGWIANTLEPDMPVLQENLATLTSKMPTKLLGVLPWDPDGQHATLLNLAPNSLIR